MGELFIKTRTLKSGKTVYEYAFEIASIDGKRKRKTKSGFATKKEASRNTIHINCYSYISPLYQKF